MTHTEFWNVLRRVFPNGRAESVAKDIALPQFHSFSAEEALAAGYPPITVWKAIIEEMNLPLSYEFLHRINPNDSRKI